MGKNTSRYKTRISVVDTLPPLGTVEIGEIFYLRGGSTPDTGGLLIIRVVEGWMESGAWTTHTL